MKKIKDKTKHIDCCGECAKKTLTLDFGTGELDSIVLMS